MVDQGVSDITDRIREASDIVNVVSSYVTLKRAGRNFKGLCPFHTEKTPSFNVLPDKQIFKCFGCGQGGDVFKFIQAKEGLGFMEAREMLARRAGISIEIERPTVRTATGPSAPTKSDIERVNRWASRWFLKQLWETSAGEAARDYVARRGMNENSAQTFMLGFAPAGFDALRNAVAAANIPVEWVVAAGLLKRRDDGGTYDAFRNRLIFPIFDAMNRVIGFGGRALDDDPAKYLNSPQTLLFDKSRCLFGLHSAKDAFAKTRKAIVVEGYVDCLMAQQFGFQHTVATLGTALTSEHVRLLRRYVDGVVLVFDSDEAGQRAADRSLGVFVTEKLDVQLSHVPKGKDPADLLLSDGAEAFEAVLTSAVDALEFKWNQVMSRYRDGASGSDRSRAIEEYLSLVASSTDFGTIDPIQRGLILNQVGKLLGLPIEEVHRQLRIVSRRLSQPLAASSGTPVERSRFRSPNEATAAMRELLSVLVNAPHLYDEVSSVFDPGLIADRDLRMIAEGFVNMVLAGEVFTIARLISRFESAEHSQMITDLQLDGERRGNYENVIDHVASRLKGIRESETRERLLAELKEGKQRKVLTDEAGSSGEASLVESDRRAASDSLADLSRRVNHFAPRKYLAAPFVAGAD